MSKKQTNKKTDKEEPKNEQAPVNASNNIPVGSTQEDITPRIADEPKESFDERTAGNNQPWLDEDGSQMTGAGDTTEADRRS